MDWVVSAKPKEQEGRGAVRGKAAGRSGGGGCGEGVKAGGAVRGPRRVPAFVGRTVKGSKGLKQGAQVLCVLTRVVEAYTLRASS